jgi:hypothetical protein
LQNEKRLKAQQNKILELQDTECLSGKLALLDGVSDEAKDVLVIIPAAAGIHHLLTLNIEL